MERYYPGHAYVDWVAVSVYGAQTSGEDWKSFGAVMDKVYDRLQKLAPGKPLMIPEWGVGEFPTKGDKAKWYADALLALRTKYTRIKIAVLYSERWTNSDSSVSDLRVNSTPAALAAYKKGVSAAYFHDSYKASLAK